MTTLASVHSSFILTCKYSKTLSEGQNVYSLIIILLFTHHLRSYITRNTLDFNLIVFILLKDSYCSLTKRTCNRQIHTHDYLLLYKQ